MLQIEDGLVGPGAEIEGIDQSKAGAKERDDGGDADEVPDAEAGGAHGGDFRVGGETAEAEQDSDEHGHGDAEQEDVGQREKKDLKDGEKAGAVADDHFEDLFEGLHEQDEGEQCATQQGVGRDFAENVAGEDAHE